MIDVKKFRETFPPKMLAEKRFVRYFLKPRAEGGMAKVPLGSHSDPSTWSTFDECVAALENDQQGIGYNFLGGEVFAFDIDHCRNPITGMICNEVMLLLSRLGGWAEFSVSGQGIHVLGYDSTGIRGKELSETCLQFWHPAKAPRFFAITCDMVGEAFTKLKDWNGQGNYVFSDAKRISAKIREELKEIDAEQWEKLPPEREQAEPVTREKSKTQRKRHKDFNLQHFLEWAGLKVDNEAEDKDLGHCYRLTSCPIKGDQHANHNSRTTDLILTKEGGIGFNCNSTGCKEYGFPEVLRELEKERGEYPGPIYEESDVIALDHRPDLYVPQAEKVLVATESLMYFSRGQDLVKPVLCVEAEEVKGLERDSYSVVIQLVSTPKIIRDLAANASFVMPTGKNFRPVAPTENLANHLRSRVECGEAKYRILKTVTQAPCLLPSGRVLDTPDYAEGVLYTMKRAKFPAIPSNPTREQAIEALKKFDQVFSKFCYVSEAGESWDKTPSHAVTLAMVLSLIARPALQTVPLCGATATVRGSGKTKLVEAICLSALGWLPTRIAHRDEDELEKSLTPLLREGDRACLIDNISHDLRSDCLCAVITSMEFSARILGKSERLKLLNNAVFFATGNNLTIEGDLARRALLIRLDPNMEQPELRQFDFEPVARARELYPELVSAALTALHAYILAGKPWALKRAKLGSFEEWDSLITGCLVWAGYADPCITQKHVVQHDPERESALELLQAWHEEFGQDPLPLSKVREQEGEVYRLLCGKEGGWNNRQVAWRLRRMEGRIVRGYRLGRSSEYSSEAKTYWMVTSDRKQSPQVATQTSFDGDIYDANRE
jgi:putative DNA primase/helicase